MSKKQSSTPHDALFKLFLRQPDTARDFLAFHLPAPIHALCDMKTLKLESSSFIDDDLRESYSDVLWSVKTEQGPGYIYCLIEHQSTSNKLIAFRMMRYAVRRRVGCGEPVNFCLAISKVAYTLCFNATSR